MHTRRGVFNYAQEKKTTTTRTQTKTHIPCIYPLHPFENSFSFTCKVAARGLEGHSRPLRDTVSEASPTIARLNTGTTQLPLMLHGRLEAAITNQRRNRGRLFCGALKGKFHVVHRAREGWCVCVWGGGQKEWPQRRKEAAEATTVSTVNR